MENFFFLPHPRPLQLERGALPSGLTGAHQAERFVWVFPLSQESELPSPCRGRVGDGALAAKDMKLSIQELTPK
jgi:hypothetical protein